MENLQGLFGLENKILGKGSFGTVYLGTDISKERYVALKKIPKNIINNPQTLQLLSNEILISAGVQSKNLVKILDITDINYEKYIVYEYCNGGDLRRYLQFFYKFDERAIQYIMTQILRGLSELHSKGIVHHDLKPENVLVELFPSDNNKINLEEKKSYEKIINDILQLIDKGNIYQNIDYTNRGFVLKSLLQSRIKLSDFGLSKFKGEINQRELSGSPVYMDPNLFIPNVPITIIENERVDIWALGVFAYELFFGYRPFNPRTQTMPELIQILQNGRYIIDLNQCGKISKQFISFLNMCLQRDQKIRSTANELLFSEFITRDPSKFDYINLNNLSMTKFPNYSYINNNGQIIMSIDDRKSVSMIFNL